MPKKLETKLRLKSLLLLISLFLGACVGRTPSLSANRGKRAEKPKRQREEPLHQEHRAPPPAYGNKIVLAQR